MKAIELVFFKEHPDTKNQTVDQVIAVHCPTTYFKNNIIEFCEINHADCKKCWDQEVNESDYINDYIID